MRRALAAAALVAAVAAGSLPWWADAAPKPPKPPPSYVPGPIAISRIRFEVRQGRVMVTTDLTFPSGRDVREDLDVHVAYGGPGMPIALDAQLLSTPKGYLVAPVDLAGDKLSTVASKRSPSHAAFSVGRAEMAGVLVHMPAALVTERLAATGQATLRLREIRDLPAPLSDGTREVLARLGAFKGRPLVLGLLELTSDEPIARTEARFCGIEARPSRLFVAASAPGRGGVAPPLADRSANDDLCLKFGPAQTQPAASASARR
ncbi:MAG: hypothetical protein HY898_35525 [Deltaproteobacteria bacterium]|nr:hypothetical protein [Deltaproteobacteria bacterium]